MSIPMGHWLAPTYRPLTYPMETGLHHYNIYTAGLSNDRQGHSWLATVSL